MRITAKKLREQAEEQRKIRLSQPQVTSEKAREQFERVQKGSRQ